MHCLGEASGPTKVRTLLSSLAGLLSRGSPDPEELFKHLDLLDGILRSAIVSSAARKVNPQMV